MSSEFQLPIFISSTEYNLIDLRRELCYFLSQLGYKPMLSSSEGFHDYTPSYTPWESCLKVVYECPIVILIIDNKYGAKLKWKNYSDILECDELSPTHAEYIYSHKLRKRLLVFIRNEILTFYQSFKEINKQLDISETERMDILRKTIPSRIDVDVFKLIEEVKTRSPIPWIKSFDSVIDIKAEVQKKMLNHLTEYFSNKDKIQENIIFELNRLLDEVPDDKRKEILGKILGYNEIYSQVEEQIKEIKILKSDSETIRTKISKLEMELRSARIEKAENEKELQNQLNEQKEKLKLKDRLIWECENKNVLNLLAGSGSFSQNAVNYSAVGNNINTWLLCEQCHCQSSPLSSDSSLKKCPSCNRYLCIDCYGRNGFYIPNSHCNNCK